MNNGKNKKHKTTYKEVLMVFYEYLRRPKTVFDVKDRTKGILLLIAIIILLQKVVQMLSD